MFYASELRRVWSRTLVTLVITGVTAHALGGSIFDDDWSPPKLRESQQRTPQVSPSSKPSSPDESLNAPKSVDSSEQVATNRPSPTPTFAAIPSSDEVRKSSHQLKVVFERELADPLPSARRHLAELLLTEFDKANYTSADRYAIICGAIDAAREAHLLQLEFAAADKMTQLFGGDPLPLKVNAALATNLGASDPDFTDNVNSATGVLDELIESDDLAAADKLLDSLRHATAHRRDLKGAVLRRAGELKKAHFYLSQVQPSLKILEKSPSDPSANLAVGLYYCLKHQAWKTGLPFLARGADPALKNLANRELHLGTGLDSALQLGDDWWDRGEARGIAIGDSRAYKAHAAALYRFGEPAAKGLQAEMVQKRLDNVAAFAKSGPDGAQAAVATTNNQRSDPSTDTPSRSPVVVNLFQHVALDRDIIYGQWQFTHDGLSCTSTPETFCLLRIGYEPPEEYDLRVDFTMKKLMSWCDVFISGSSGGLPFATRTGAGRDAACDISGGSDQNAVSTRSYPVYRENQRYALVVKVRRDGVSTFVDGKCVAKTANITKGAFNWWAFYAGDRLFGLGTFDSIAVHSLSLVEISGRGKPVKGPELGVLPPLKQAAPDDQSRRVVNLMPIINTDKDTIEGHWEFLPRGALRSAAKGPSRLRLPYVPPKEYDFSVTFRRNIGGGFITQMVPDGESNVAWIMGICDNTVTGFEFLAGNWLATGPTTLYAPRSFTNGRIYKSVVYVRRDFIAASVDGKLVAYYKTDGTDLSIGKWFSVGGTSLGIGAADEADFLAIDVREIVGDGKVLPH